MYKLDNFEQTLLSLLTNPDPQPKHPLWSIVPEGQIVGFHFESPSSIFAEGGCSEPGWYYHVQSDRRIDVYHESEIKRVEVAA